MRIVRAPMDTDEDLLAALAGGDEEAVGRLYARYAPIVLGMASQALDRATAEEVVQDVFTAVWKNAASFDPARGPVRPWLLQIAHYRIANELRTRSRRPRIEADPDGERLAGLPDPAPDQQATAWTEYRRSALKRALEQLPPPQRQALGLAFYEDLSHGEIARVLKLPLGTAKSRVRAGLLALRGKLAPLVAALAFVALLAGVVYEATSGRRERSREERAIAMADARSGRARCSGRGARSLPLPARLAGRGDHVLVLRAGSGRTRLPGLGARRWPLDLARHRAAGRRGQGPPHRGGSGALGRPAGPRGHARTRRRRPVAFGSRRRGLALPLGTQARARPGARLAARDPCI
jgi:RNA polymerase sigma-70 factor (ECF subfamily)